MNIDKILDKIDDVVGAPQDETPEERERRKQMVSEHDEARRIRKAANF